MIHVFTNLVNSILGTTLQSNRKAIQYEIMCQDDTRYIADGFPLFDFCADIADGCAARVWKVYKKGDGQKDVFVLKDSWMLLDSTSEGDIMRDLPANFSTYMSVV